MMVGTVIKVTKMKQLYFLIGIFLFRDLVIDHGGTVYDNLFKRER